MARYVIAAMQPGFIKAKTVLPPEEKEVKRGDIGLLKENGAESSKREEKKPKGVWLQICNNCKKEHIESVKRKQCSRCGTFLPAGEFV